MKKFGLLIMAMFITSTLFSCGPKNDSVDMAKTFVELLTKGDYRNAIQDFDDTMKGAMPPEKLEESWQSLLGQVGSFKKQVSTKEVREQGFGVVYVTCEFERGTINIKVVFNSEKQISGLWFVPIQ